MSGRRQNLTPDELLKFIQGVSKRSIPVSLMVIESANFAGERLPLSPQGSWSQKKKKRWLRAEIMHHEAS
jgi:hypothetical protein